MRTLIDTCLMSPVLWFMVLAAFGSTQTGDNESPITIDVTTAPGSGIQGVRAFLNGYRATIDGQILAYHSSHPDADSALLVRTRRDALSIAWETDTLPQDFPGDFYQFVWLAGIDCRGWGSTVERTFTLFINDEPWFTFHNRKDASAPGWTETGRDGAELRFESQLADRFDDLFGYMYLRIPQKSFAPGAPLRLRVEAEDAESPEWYMTFQYRFNFTPRLRSEPALLRDGDRATQMLRLSLDNLEEGRSVTIAIPGREAITQAMAVGANIICLPFPAVSAEEQQEVVFRQDGKLVDRFHVVIQPVPPRDIYLLPYSHNDIGYTDLQPTVERKHWAHLEEALHLIEQTRNYPPEARFKWNMEILWPLESYLTHASPERQQELLDAVRAGSIGLNALYVNPLSGLAGAVEMAHFMDFARAFTNTYGIPIPTATVSDIPGFTWGMVTALAQNGVKYFSSAPNPFDRIGHVVDQWGDKPFYWRSQSGQETVLLWIVGASYAAFHEGTLTTLGDEKIMRLGRKLNESDYPYDIYGLPYTLGDNGGPDTSLPAYVKSWNERFVQPRLILATHEQLFTEFEKRYGATLPTYAGDFTPYWEDGAASTARETAMNRHAVDRLIQGEAIWSMRAPQEYPHQLYAKAWRQAVLWDEHTWGADKSVSHPDDAGTIGQWQHKQRFALNADSLSTALLDRVLPTPPPPRDGDITLDIYNTTSWPRRDLVILTPEQSRAGDLVVDSKGQFLPSQRLATGELALLIDSIPPFAATRITVRTGAANSRGEASASENRLDNALLSVSIDSATGAIGSLIVKSNSRQLVDASRGMGLNQYIYVSGKNPDSAQYISNVRIRILENGPVVASLLVEADAPGCRSFATEYRLISGLNRVDIINRIDKTAVRSKEGVHFAFPFSVPNGRLRYDVAAGIVEPERNQLAGSCKNFFSVESWVDLSDDFGGITWITPDAPLVEIGAITAEAPWLKMIQPSGTFYSYVMNNYWHTNYKADQEGPAEFRYAIIPHRIFWPEEVVRFGREGRRPLLVTVVDSAEPPQASLLTIDSNVIIVESIRPLADGRAWLLYLYNPSERFQKAGLHWNSGDKMVIMLSDSGGNRGCLLNGSISLPPFGTVFVRVEEKE